MTDLETLAERVIEVLDTQARYFKTRDRDILIQSKGFERELRKQCETILRDKVSSYPTAGFLPETTE